MPMEKRQRHDRRQDARGYGPSRRSRSEALFFGLERRRNQRRQKDRRMNFRRTVDRPDENLTPLI
ncbi:MAG: hypothetical protein HY204_01770 [Nitrospirae bacterium]|nr:hypothetical protein [Nitrospirota bacterium]